MWGLTVEHGSSVRAVSAMSHLQPPELFFKNLHYLFCAYISVYKRVKIKGQHSLQRFPYTLYPRDHLRLAGLVTRAFVPESS